MLKQLNDTIFPGGVVALVKFIEEKINHVTAELEAEAEAEAESEARDSALTEAGTATGAEAAVYSSTAKGASEAGPSIRAQELQSLASAPSTCSSD